MNIEKHNKALDAVIDSEEFALQLHANPALTEFPKRTVATFFDAMQAVLPPKVWACPVMGGYLLRMMCQTPEVAGAMLADEARAWTKALGGRAR